MEHKLSFIVLLALVGCGTQDARLGGTTGLQGAVNPGKPLDEPVVSESDLSSTESALTLGPSYVPLCAAGNDWARCHSHIRLDGSGQVYAASTPQGLSPSELRSAYKLPSAGGSGLTVAIVDALDDPTAEADLAVYRAQYGLPACTSANGCFKKVNQSGSTSSLPKADEGWAGEIALDLDMVSAICPDCNILLVEATSASMADLGAAVNTAVRLGAVAVSNSYGGSEDSTVTSAETTYFNHPGVFITASSGDDGFGASYPATSAHVTAVGGTTLTRSTSASRGWTEKAWSGAGSGCSTMVAKPSWQKDTSCTKRMMADVAAVADPNSGVAVYCSYGNNGGWSVVGGTSAASPIIASTFALTALTSQTAQYSYAHTDEFFDVTSGSNGSCSGKTYECTAVSGYDGPTGNGTPNGALLTSGAGGGSGSTGGGSGSTGGGSGSTGGGSGSTGGGSGSTGGGSGSTGGGSGGGTGSTASEKEANNSRATANLLTSGVTMVGSISSSSDVDYFKLVVTPGQTLDLVLSNLSADCDLKLYSSSGSLVSVSNSSGTANDEIKGTLSNSIYYAKVYGQSGATCASYHLLATLR
jgi:hypothetical protein